MNLKIFISYSWTTPEHEEWVVNLAERLMADGINVVLDKWDLKEGNDLYSFMEEMVNSEDIKKVLIILDKRYAENANKREGGVGTETQIISPKIYKKVKQEKFIPVVAEKDIDGNAYIPTYLKGKVYIDLSEIEHYEEGYDKLLRNLYDRPLYHKPKLGTAPTHLFEEKPSNFKTSFILKGFENQITKKPHIANSIIRDFFSEFLICLKEFKINFKTNNRIEEGKLICDNLIQYNDLRKDYLEFLTLLIQKNIAFDIEIIISFFENLTGLKSPDENIGSYYPHHYDNFKFIIHELYLYSVAIGLKNESYSFVEEILYSSYFTKDRNNYNNEPKHFEEFYGNIESINTYYNQTFSKTPGNTFFSPMADFIIKRIPENLAKEDIVQADLLCYYVAEINNWRWFPLTYIYATRKKFEFFYKITSKRHFEKVKKIFAVETASEFKKKLNELKDSDKGNDFRIRYSNSFEAAMPIYQMIEIEKIGTLR